ncbi:uncharacterized protein LOC106513546, partial [Tachysurus ichikawai]
SCETSGSRLMKRLLANQPDIVMVDKEQKMAVVIDVETPAESNIRKKEREKAEKNLELKENWSRCGTLK